MSVDANETEQAVQCCIVNLTRQNTWERQRDGCRSLQYANYMFYLFVPYLILYSQCFLSTTIIKNILARSNATTAYKDIQITEKLTFSALAVARFEYKNHINRKFFAAFKEAGTKLSKGPNHLYGYRAKTGRS